MFERAIAWAASGPRAPALERARVAFERRTGPIVSGSKDYEARIGHFFEQALCAPLAPDAVPWVAQFAAETALDEHESLELAGWLRSYRSLWKFEFIRGRVGQVQDLIGGARFRFTVAGADGELRRDDCFDGRLIALERELFLSPGRVFHPQAAQMALRNLLTEAGARGTRNASLLDPLLGMRSRWIGFESIRAEHVYRIDALDAQGLAAPWARVSKRSTTDCERT